MKKILIPTLFTFLFLFSNLMSGQQASNLQPEILRATPSGQARNPKQSNIFRIAFYNVENLFDTIDDPAIDDAEFLPEANIPWTSARYETKLNHTAEVLKALSDPKPVAVMGLSEVENDRVLQELVSTPSIIPYNYQVIHRDSPDERGIDNAMLYDKLQFKPVYIRAIPVILSDPEDKTRDILYVKGVNLQGKTRDTLHIFVNHWPSRYGGQETSEPKRITAAETLKAVSDSIMNASPMALVVIIGDLNDEPADKSLAALKAVLPDDNPRPGTLYNLMYPLYNEGKGTLYYKDWDVFDQVILNGRFWLKEKGLVYDRKEGNIFDAEWLMFKSKDGTLRPNRTSAREYYGGYSDHLPVYVDLRIK